MKYKVLIFLSFILLLLDVKAQNCYPDSSKRVRIMDNNIPNEYTCYMEMTRGWHKYYGSGALIHPRVMITAGHNLAYFPFVKRIPFFLFRGTRKVDLYFGSIDSGHYTTSTSLKLKKCKNKFFKRGYWINSKINRDFSIIILPDSSIYKKVRGHYKFVSVKPDELQGSELHITGSPGDQDLFEMWTEGTKNFSVVDASLHYDLYTVVRNSGSPIWIKDNNNVPQLVGVHSRGLDHCNGSVLINAETYKQVVEWCKKSGINLEK
ncbi:trypsin-like serine peptidase [Pedobacter sp. P26]|uniref:trypsin-like serine peptidase n=1 Tax=Pedobacter sp. P26 TaxID=3423956 RepID=UPI003D67675D